MWKVARSDLPGRERSAFEATSGVEVGNELFLFSGYDFVNQTEVWNQTVYSYRP